jgi:peptidyl-tRNA hydrolase, PTH1 family
VRSKLGGGVAGHNGLKSLSQGLGGKDFWRVRGGVGRPDSTDPEIVSAHVLSRFREPKEHVQALIGAAADEAERLVERITAATESAEEAD